jgi:hypothetical protein|eukprot:COSAG01_NODE_4696_length_4806_cov_4.618016_4_plen_122_part_00
MQKHLGSAETGFVWFRKKNKMADSCNCLSKRECAIGVDALFSLSAPNRAGRMSVDEHDDLFRRAGGRSGKLSKNAFVKFFGNDESATEVRRTVPTATVVQPLTCIWTGVCSCASAVVGRTR